MSRLSPAALARLQPLLDELQRISGLTQIKPAIFYWRRIPMLHFHETKLGIVADLKCVVPVLAGFDRLQTGSAADRRKIVKEAVARCALLEVSRPVKRS
jgi:hypothetical protein